MKNTESDLVIDVSAPFTSIVAFESVFYRCVVLLQSKYPAGLHLSH